MVKHLILPTEKQQQTREVSRAERISKAISGAERRKSAYADKSCFSTIQPNQENRDPRRNYVFYSGDF